MNRTLRTLALALTVSTGALWAQETQTPTPPANPPADEPTTSAAPQPTDPATPNPPATANPTNQESDALPQSGAQSPETTPPVTEEPLPVTAPPAENPKPVEPAPKPAQDIVSGTVVSTSASALVVETMSGAKLTFVIDSATVEPELHAKDSVSVEYSTTADGTKHANRVTIATPKKAAAAAAPRKAAPPAAKKPALAPAEPLKSVAVTPSPAAVPAPAPAAPVTDAAATAPAATVPAAEPVTSGATTDSPESHTLNTDAQAVNPLATAKVVHDASPVRMVVPVVILLGGLLFITVLGVRQARREA